MTNQTALSTLPRWRKVIESLNINTIEIMGMDNNHNNNNNNKDANTTNESFEKSINTMYSLNEFRS